MNILEELEDVKTAVIAHRAGDWKYAVVAHEVQQEVYVGGYRVGDTGQDRGIFFVGRDREKLQRRLRRRSCLFEVAPRPPVPSRLGLGASLYLHPGVLEAAR